MLRSSLTRALISSSHATRRHFSTASSPGVYFVMGANGGIGSNLCQLLLERGGKVALACRNEESMEQLHSKLIGVAGNDSDRIMKVKVDATQPGEVDAGVKAVLEKWDRIDGAVNCVGSIVLKPAHQTTEKEFAETLSINLNSSFSLLRSVARPMMKQKSGSVVFCSSAVANIGIPNHEAIAAAKAGVVGLARSAASTYAKHGIRVNVVSPGLTDTGIAQRIVGNEAALKASVALHPLGRIGQPDEPAKAIAFLLEQSFVTGQVLAVDGGLGSLK